jgi:hypothetical protein
MDEEHIHAEETPGHLRPLVAGGEHFHLPAPDKVVRVVVKGEHRGLQALFPGAADRGSDQLGMAEMAPVEKAQGYGCLFWHGDSLRKKFLMARISPSAQRPA